VAVEVEGATRLARPARPLVPSAPAELLVLDVGRPTADWTRLLDDPEPPDRALSTVDAAIRDLSRGSVLLPSTAELRHRLRVVDQRLAATAEWAAGPSIDRRVAARLAEEAGEHALAAAELAAEREALDDDLAATEASVAAARADEQRVPGGSAPAGPLPSARRLSADGVALDRLEAALAARDAAAGEAVAAANTAAVCRRAVAARRPARPRVPAWAQPALLLLAVGLVGLAVVLLAGDASGWAVVVAVGAASTAVVALLVPGRPSRPALPVSVEQLDRRRQRAESDQRRWEAERSARSAAVEELALHLGLSADVAVDDLVRRRDEQQRALESRLRSEDADRRRTVARNTGDAAGERHRQLLGQRAVLEARLETVAHAWATWRKAHDLPAWSVPDDAVECYRAVAAGLPAPGDDPAELRQLRQGLLEELGRRTRELDRLALARWLLRRAAAAPSPAAVPPAPSPRAGPVAPAELRVRTGELLSLASGGRVVGVRVELPDRPVLSLAGGGELALGADRDARVLADLCAVLAVGELAAAPARWPLVVGGLEAWPAGAGREVVRDLLTEVARRTQVLVVGAPADAANGAGATGRPGIRVAVTPSE
jgi:hypothetical protein